MNLLRKLLLPIVPVYYFVSWLRNKLYDAGLKKSTHYDFPVIAVGNLSVGGTGKSPMVEYLIRLLKEKVKLATLSRGYKRKTSGFMLVNTDNTAIEVGDEPLQFKTKFKDVLVGVDADRKNGINELRSQKPRPDVVVLDDAYQHRKVTAGFYILLTAYYNLYCDDIVLPTGNLREPISGADRADIIVVTKCPQDISEKEQNNIRLKLNLNKNQILLFSCITYGFEIISGANKKDVTSLKDISFTLVTGIANPKPLVEYYKELGLKFKHISFPDHHNFTEKELNELREHDFIITTEKDYMRLVSGFGKDVLWYQPIISSFVRDQHIFDQRVLAYVLEV